MLLNPPALRTTLFVAFVFFTAQCARSSRSEVVWSKDFPRIGSQSSPRATDINNDGVRDIIIGAGENEGQASEFGVLALDGKTGNLLWKQSCDDQMYGTPALYDVTGDHVDDVFIGGRSPNFKALDGKTGHLLWEFRYQHDEHPVLQYARFNFNNAVVVPDQNGNGFDDLLTVNGGNSLAAPYSTEGRYPGVLMLFDSKTGEVIAADTMPDGKESYMSPLAYASTQNEDPVVVFGTGGETLSGALYLISLSAFVKDGLSASQVIARETGHGFIAPPTIADINNDNIGDIIAISHAGTVFAIDGATRQMLWQQSVPDTESSNSLAAGYFTDDEVPDFFTFVSRGQWPNNTGTLQVMIDGRDGTIAFMDSLGCTGFSSPVVYDLNNDGRDEAIASVNVFDCSVGYTGQSPSEMENRLVAFDFSRGQYQRIDYSARMKNIFSTPWIGDLDDDGYLDIIHCQYFHHGYLLNFLGMRVRRISTPIRAQKPVRWGAYMGTRGNGVWEGE